jgi:hypothetical protein
MSDLRNLLVKRKKRRSTVVTPAPESRMPDDDAPENDGQSPHRAALARWPVEWREKWGYRANALEDSGLNWRDAEIQAFVEVWNERRAGPPMELASFPMVGVAVGN